MSPHQVILSVFKALLLCHGFMLLIILCMFFTVKSPSMRPASPFIAIIGSLLCPLACPEVCAIYLGTGPIWELFEETRHTFAGLKEEQVTISSSGDVKEEKAGKAD